MAFKHRLRRIQNSAVIASAASMTPEEVAEAEVLAKQRPLQRKRRFRGRVTEVTPADRSGRVVLETDPAATTVPDAASLTLEAASPTLEAASPTLEEAAGPTSVATELTAVASAVPTSSPATARFLWSGVRGLGGLAPKPGDLLSFYAPDDAGGDVMRPRLVELSPRLGSDWLTHVDWLAGLLRRDQSDGDKELAGESVAAAELVGALRARLVWRALIGCRELEAPAALGLCRLLADLGGGGDGGGSCRLAGQFCACVGACLSQLLPPPPLPPTTAGAAASSRHQALQTNYFIGALRKALSAKLPDASRHVGDFVRFCTDQQQQQHRCTAFLPQLASVIVAAGRSDDVIFSLLLDLLRRQLGENFPALGDGDGDGRPRESWLDMPSVPSGAELQEAMYVRGLEPVVVKGPYRSVDHYYDTYFRLYRADCFERIVTGIAKLRSGELDPRDMPLYGQVRVWAVRLSSHACPLSIAVQFNELGGRQATNWRKSGRLMQGNLVCLSTDGRFEAEGRPLVWATVCGRDPNELDRHRVIWLELGCGGADSGVAGGLTDTEALQALVAATPGGATLMAESPSLFRAFEPVLRSLQASGSRAGGCRLPFKSVLVDADMREAVLRPRYIQDYYDLGLAALPTISTGPVVLDPCQTQALTNALHRRVALIQGPPGTGKSFLGVLLMRQILSLPTLPKGRPVLVMSYKNHALDEFLADLLPLFPDQVVRVGGRCSKPELEAVSLNTLRKDKVKHPKSRGLNHDFYSVYSESEALQASLKRKFNRVSSLLSKPGVLVQEAASQAQLRTLIVNWRPGPALQVLQRQAAIDAWTDMKTAADDTDAVSQWLLDPKVAGALHTAVACWLPSHAEQQAASASADTSAGGGAFGESPLARVLAKFEQRSRELFGAADKGKGKRGKKQQQKEQKQQQPGKDANNDDDNDDDDEDAQFQMQQRQSAFIGQLMSNKQRATDAVIQFARQDGLLAGGLMATEGGSDVGRLAARRADLWRLNVGERCALARHWLLEAVTRAMADIETQLADYLNVSVKRRRMQRRHCIEIVKTKRILGMTITGASINKDILMAVKPAVILVEEAAEVGEPQLLSCLTEATQHLILIGDHKQLRPQTESYTLRVDFHLDISMFERLINNGIPYDQLELQNRMRPEFSRLLLDIYPNLRDNLAVVGKREPVACLAKSMFFWTHSHPEYSDRSYMNEEEAHRAVLLAAFLVEAGGVKPEDITILAMYRGQTALIRRLLKAELLARGLLPPAALTAAPANPGGQDLPIAIHTVDLYQGDENDVIIVSLVRSNPFCRLGFLKDLSRRCVAQSRARRGMYLLGNADCLAGDQRHTLWRPLVAAMTAAECLGPRLRIVCPRHRDSGAGVDVPAGDGLGGGKLAGVKFPATFDFCDRLCDAPMDCGQHRCQKLCRQAHRSHRDCQEMVEFLYTGCAHPGQRMCSDDPADLQCMARVQILCKKCGQSDTKACHQPPERWECPQPCLDRLPCGHPCPEKCGEPCPTALGGCRTCRDLETARQQQTERQVEEIFNLARQETQAEYDRVCKEPEEFKLIPVERDTSEFFDVEDRVTKFVQLEHGWFPSVSSVSRLRNAKLRKQWLVYRKNTAFDPTRVELKFHGTSTAGVDGITKKGFKMPEKPGMYGKGIYFASDASKSAQAIYTKGSETLLLCEVILGRSLRVTAATNTNYDWKELRTKAKCDSIFAPRGTKETGGVLFDEFVVFNPQQAYPKYVVKYTSISGSAALTKIAATSLAAAKLTAGNHVTKITAALALAKEDSPEYVHYSIANSQFLASFQQGASPYRVAEVWHNANPRLEAMFAAKRVEFEARYGRDNEFSRPVFAFHGTKTAAIVDSILRENFDLSKLKAFACGFGVYLSEFVNVSVDYGTEMLLCQVLPGKPQEGSPANERKGPGYDSIRVQKDAEGRGWALVVDNVDQILPLYKVVFGK